MYCDTLLWGEGMIDSWFLAQTTGHLCLLPVSLNNLLEAQLHLLACTFPACGCSQSTAIHACHQRVHDLKIFSPQPPRKIHRDPSLWLGIFFFMSPDDNHCPKTGKTQGHCKEPLQFSKYSMEHGNAVRRWVHYEGNGHAASC